MKTKNKMLKKAISLVTAAVMALGMMSSGAFAAEIIENEATSDTLVSASETVKLEDFMTGKPVTSYDNFILNTDQGALNENPPRYKQPAFFKFDLSGIDKDTMLKVYAVWSCGTDNKPFRFYDVPGNDITVTKPEGSNIPNRIEINSDIIGEARSGAKLSEDMFPLGPSDYNMYLDVTDYIAGKIAAGQTSTSIMVAAGYGGTYYVGKSGVKLYVKSNDIPTVSISVPETIKQGNLLNITADVTDNNTIAAATVEVGDTAIENVAIDGKTVSAVAENLDAGKYTVKVTVTDAYGATGTATADVIVRGAVTTPEVRKTVYFSESANPNFAANLDYSGRKLSGTDNPDRRNLVIDSSGKTDESPVAAAIFLKFDADINKMIDPDEDGIADYDLIDAYLLMGDETRGAAIQIYDVPSNEISIDSMKDSDGNMVMPEISEPVSSTSIGVAREAFAALSESNQFENIDTEKMGTAFELKDYIVSKNGQFSIMMYTSHNDTARYLGAVESTDDGKTKMPRLYFHLAVKPEVRIESLQQQYTGEALTVNVEAADEANGIKEVNIYVDDELKATVTEAENGIYTADISGLSFGTRTVKAVAVSNTGATASSERTVYISNSSATVKNLYRADIELANSKVTVTKNMSKADSLNTNDKAGKHIWLYQYDVSQLKKENPNNIEKVTMKSGFSKFNGMSMNIKLINTDYVISENSTYEEITAAINDITGAGTELGRYSGADNNGKTIEIDVTSAVKDALASEEYGSIFTISAGGAYNWGGLLEGVQPVEFEFKMKDTTPAFVTENGDGTITIAVNPAKYAGENDSSISVVTATYDNGKLVGAETKTLSVRDKYSVYSADVSDKDYKIFVFDSVNTLKPLLDTPVTK